MAGVLGLVAAFAAAPAVAGRHAQSANTERFCGEFTANGGISDLYVDRGSLSCSGSRNVFTKVYDLPAPTDTNGPPHPRAGAATA